MDPILAAVLVMAAVTLFTRAFPFLLFSRRRPPGWFLAGARLIPGAVMTVLVFTSLPLVPPAWREPQTLCSWGAAAVTALLHLKFRNPLVSIFGGTGLYMAALAWFC